MVITLFLILKTGTQNWTPYLFIYLLTDGTSLVNYKRIVSELENSLVYGGHFAC